MADPTGCDHVSPSEAVPHDEALSALVKVSLEIMVKALFRLKRATRSSALPNLSLDAKSLFLSADNFNLLGRSCALPSKNRALKSSALPNLKRTAKSSAFWSLKRDDKSFVIIAESFKRDAKSRAFAKRSRVARS